MHKEFNGWHLWPCHRSVVLVAWTPKSLGQFTCQLKDRFCLPVKVSSNLQGGLDTRDLMKPKTLARVLESARSKRCPQRDVVLVRRMSCASWVCYGREVNSVCNRGRKMCASGMFCKFPHPLAVQCKPINSKAPLTHRQRRGDTHTHLHLARARRCEFAAQARLASLGSCLGSAWRVSEPLCSVGGAANARSRSYLPRSRRVT